jgi:hypothetical protein
VVVIWSPRASRYLSPIPGFSCLVLSFLNAYMILARVGFMQVESMDQAIEVSDKIAPEHLEVQTRDAETVAFRCGNYGAVFIGHGAAEVLGDYGAVSCREKTVYHLKYDRRGM